MMAGLGSPANQRLFITPGRKREYPSFPGEAAIAHIIDKAFDLFQFGLEHLALVKIGIPLIRVRLDFKNDRKHGSFLAAEASHRPLSQMGAPTKAEERLGSQSSGLLFSPRGLLKPHARARVAPCQISA